MLKTKENIIALFYVPLLVQDIVSFLTPGVRWYSAIPSSGVMGRIATKSKQEKLLENVCHKSSTGKTRQCKHKESPLQKLNPQPFRYDSTLYFANKDVVSQKL